MINIPGQAKSGRYVIIQMDNADEINYHEVEVYGRKSKTPMCQMFWLLEFAMYFHNDPS